MFKNNLQVVHHVVKNSFSTKSMCILGVAYTFCGKVKQLPICEATALNNFRLVYYTLFFFVSQSIFAVIEHHVFID